MATFAKPENALKRAEGNVETNPFPLSVDFHMCVSPLVFLSAYKNCFWFLR
jgi:hypothetical protein